jgi:phospholipid transport system substrate-binding protein
MERIIMKKVLKIFILLGLLVGAGYCDSKSLVQDLGNRAIITLTNSSDSAEAIGSRFLALLDEGFDVQGIASFVLGPYWGKMSEKQKDQFKSLFKTRLKNAYASRFREYRGVDFKVGEVMKEAAGFDWVKSTIQKPGGPKTEVKWRIKDNKIHDVVVEGISMSQTLQAEYRSLLNQKNGNIESFLTALTPANAAGAKAVAKK